jgi:hypothetical protein
MCAPLFVFNITGSHTANITGLETLTGSQAAYITALETLTASHTADILTKLYAIQDGDLTIAKTDGLQTVLDATANSLRQILVQDQKLLWVI